MNCWLKLKNWKIQEDEKTKLPKVVGSYVIMMGDKEIATQDFNQGYSGKEVPFSDNIIQELRKVEELIKTEMEKMFT